MPDPVAIPFAAPRADEAEPSTPATVPEGAATYTRPQLAALIQVELRTLERWDAAGKLPAGARLNLPGRLCRYSRAIIDQWISEGCPAPARPRKR